MAREFKEVAALRTNKEKFDEGWDRIFGKKNKKTESQDEDKSESTKVESTKGEE